VPGVLSSETGRRRGGGATAGKVAAALSSTGAMLGTRGGEVEAKIWCGGGW
jgi:hypothetical protein